MGIVGIVVGELVMLPVGLSKHKPLHQKQCGATPSHSFLVVAPEEVHSDVALTLTAIATNNKIITLIPPVELGKS
jgi:hypothetical protein